MVVIKDKISSYRWEHCINYEVLRGYSTLIITIITEKFALNEHSFVSDIVPKD